MSAVTTRPLDLTPAPTHRRGLRHGLVTIVVSNACFAAVILVMVRQFSELSAAGLGLVALTAVVDLLFVTPTRLEIGDGTVVRRARARKRTFDRGAVISRPARFGRSSVLVPNARPARPLARFAPGSPALSGLVDARVAIVRR